MTLDHDEIIRVWSASNEFSQIILANPNRISPRTKCKMRIPLQRHFTKDIARLEEINGSTPQIRERTNQAGEAYS